MGDRRSSAAGGMGTEFASNDKHHHESNEQRKRTLHNKRPFNTQDGPVSGIANGNPARF